MKQKWLILVAALIGVALVGLLLIKRNQSSSDNRKLAQEAESRVTNPQPASKVPAHYEVAPAAEDLRPLLTASQFAGKTREAYEAAKEIPVLLAQMPCYCHCDRGMGHKSLHSCFEDDHAAHCATCVDEALLAYRLQKEGLSPAQIRRQIIAEFGD